MLTAGVHRLRVSGCIPGALDLFGVLTATDLAARSSMPRHSCRLLDATVTARHGPVSNRHGQGGAIRIVIAILGAVWRPTQVGSDQPDWIRRAADVDPDMAGAYAADVNRQNATRSGCHQHPSTQPNRPAMQARDTHPDPARFPHRHGGLCAEVGA